MNTITFQKSGAGANPVVRRLTPGTIASTTTLGNNGDAVVINGGDYITFDAIDAETDPAFTAAGMIEYGYYLKKASGADACKNVTIKNCNITLNKAAIYSFGVYVSNNSGTATVTVSSTGGRSENIKIFNNTITNAYGGVQLRGFAASAPYDFYDQGNEVGENGGNAITNFGGGASTTYGIYTIYQNNCKLNNNSISGGDGTTTTHYGIFASTSNSSNFEINDNTISLVNNSTTSQVSGIGMSVGTITTPANIMDVSGNDITISRPSATTGVTYFIYSTSNAPNLLKVTNNIIHNSTLAGTGAVYGIYQISTPPNYLVEGNTIHDITRTGTTSTSLFYGISSTGSSTVLNTTISGNTIHTLTGMGSTGIVGGINLLTNLTANVFNNKIYNITSDNASGAVNGITVGSGVITGKFYNNLIGGLRTPIANNSTAISPNVRGINITSTTASSNLLVAYNTIFLDATSTGTNFGTAGIFHTFSATATTANLTLRNNLVVNNSVPNGVGRTVAFQRSGASTANYNEASNNNLLYAGAPGASRLIYADGTNSDQTIGDFKCRVAPRESLSGTENTSFLSTDGSNAGFLHINPAVPTQAESGAINIAGIEEDYDGDIRQGNPGYAGSGSAPDIGADEGGFIANDLVGPAISYTTVPNTVCLAGPSLSAAISDASGINVAPGTKPRLWFKKSTEDNVLPATNTSADNGWKWVEASNASSPFDFTFNYSLLTSPVVGGDIIQYFVVAQDLQGTPNVGAYQVSFNGCGIPSSVALSSGLFPVSGTSALSILIVPASIVASATPDAVCIIDDVTLSISPSDLGAEYQWESSPLGANTWSPIPGATTASYTVLNVSSSTDYRAIISCGGVPISSSPSTVASVVVSNPQVLTTIPGEECGPGPVSVELGATASGGATLNWYAAAAGGQPIGTGSVFNTPNITQTTTYYVAASEGGGSANTGLPAAFPTATSGAGLANFGIVFDAISTFTLQEVTLYPVASTANSAGTVTIAVIDGTGATLHSTTVNIFGNPVASIVAQTVEPSASAPGGNYGYPFTIPGVVTLLHSTLTAPPTNTPRLDLYYYFYNWLVLTGCESPRVPVVATVLNEVAVCPDDFTICLDAQPIVLTGGTPIDGVYSGPGVSNGLFNPAVAGVGPHVITFTYCNTSCEFTITVEDPVATISIVENSGNLDNDGVICAGDEVTLTASAGASYEWSTGATSQSIVVSPGSTTNYSVIVTDAFGCDAMASTQITVNPLPVAAIDPAAPEICVGFEVTLTASGGVSYEWNTGATSESITVSPAITTIYSVIVTDANGCSSEAFVTVTVNNPPIIQALVTEPTGCASTNGAIALTLTGASPYTYNWQTPNGSGLVQGQEDQSGLTVGTYFLTVTDDNGCVSTGVYTLLGPGGCDVCPLITSLATDPTPATCVNDDVILTASGLTNMGVTYGIHFKYSTTPLGDPYNGGTTIAIVPNGDLTNLGSIATTTTTFGAANTYFLYAILDPLPLDPTCRPSTSSSIVVNPNPTVNAVASQVVCNTSGTTAIAFSGAVPGTVYNWTNNNTSIGLAAAGSGNIPSFVATNGGNAPVVATITVTPEYTNLGVTCTGPSTNFTITVNPTPTVADPANQLLCAGASTSVTFSGTVAGTVFSWTNSNTAIGLGASGTGNILPFTVTNNTGATLTATITVTPSYTNGGVTCIGASQSFTITVNPLPVMNTPANQELCAGSLTQAVTFSSAVPGTVYNWTNNNTSIGLAASGVGNIAAFTATNNTGVVQVATISVTPSFTSAGLTCSGNAVTFTITVHPLATVSVGADQTICQNQSANLSATLGGSATSGTWSGGAGAFGNANALSTTYTPAASEYGTTITLTFTTNDPAGPCAAASDALQLTINTLPIVFAGPDTQICENGTLDLTSLGASIDANGSGVSTGTWSTNGTGTFQPTNAFPPGAVTYVPSAADIVDGSITITLTTADPAGPCSSVSDALALTFRGEEALVCNDTVQVSIDGDGISEVYPDMILEGTFTDQFFQVELYNGINFVGNTVDCGDIGKVLTVKVIDICYGSYCWGHITIEDKWAPTVLCNDVVIPCTVDYNNVPFPIATDNCDAFPEVELTGQTILADDLCVDNAVVVLRTFIATDNYGNQSAECTQTITIDRPDFVDFPNDIQWECSVYNQNPAVVDATFSGSGIPGNIDGEYCMYNYTHSDQILGACGTTFKIVRTWTVLDWCTGQVVTSNPQGEDNIQIIKVVDTTPPVVILPPYNVPANIQGVHPQPCTSIGFLQAADITDACNTWTVRIFTPVGEANYVNGVDGAQGGFIPSPGLGLGTHIIHYQAEDACNNITDLYVSVSVVDNIVPAAICDEITEANLSSDGLADVYAETFDDGSHDNCCLDQFQVRRMNGDCEGNFDDFGPYVTFCCSDASTAVVVVFRAIDCYGNFNDCMVTVNVNDKLPPYILTCPQGQTITCDNYLQNYAAGIADGDYSVLDGFGAPTFYDNCEYDLTHTVNVNLSNCTEGTITRSWTANDGNGPATCTQVITVTHVSDWVVEFPEDLTVQCTDGQLPDTGEPEIFHDECELVAVSHEDVIFTVVPDACYKIVRTWNVINWCIYDDFGYDAYSEAGQGRVQPERGLGRRRRQRLPHLPRRLELYGQPGHTRRLHHLETDDQGDRRRCS
ncbi:MAG: right-handed parallel beta-helix repeat-containing protein [Saprospirales bacterium]|nr:right-handed parallel beta-helix repeat-containing protein [Saprospirales bacterium]